MVYSGLSERLNTLWLRARTAFFLHANNPAVKGNDAEHLRQWCAAQEVRTMLGEQNPVVAATLLPTAEGVAVLNGLPLVPAGIRYFVAEDGTNNVDLSVEVAGVTFTVEAPGVPRFTPAVVMAATRTSTTFAARLDELYVVKLYAGNNFITSVLVPVNRKMLRALREWSRQGAYQFADRLPDPLREYTALLACWIAADDAAKAGQAQLYYDLIDLAFGTVPLAPAPTAVYPHPHNA